MNTKEQSAIVYDSTIILWDVLYFTLAPEVLKYNFAVNYNQLFSI